MTHEAESATIWRALVKEFDKAEHAQKERDRRNGLVFSLDDERLRDYLESRCMAYDVDPFRIFIRMESYRILYDALNGLLGKQAVRIYRHFFCEENYSQIARSEGVDESAVRRSIERGLIQLRKKLFGTGISTGDFAIRSPTRYVKHFHPKKEAADRQSPTSSLISIYGAPEKLKAFGGKEAQRNDRGMTFQSHFEKNGVCADAGGVANGE